MLGTTGDPGDIAGEARHAERLGFDLAAAGEHVFFHGPAASAFVTLAAAAAVTERIRLLSAVTLLPVYPMVLAAKMAATLDLVSHVYRFKTNRIVSDLRFIRSATPPGSTR